MYYLHKKVVDENLVLSYYLTLNRNIPLDAYIQRVIICTYDSETAELKASKEIGTLEQHFSQGKTKYSNWSGNQIVINERSVTEDLNTGEEILKRQTYQVSIDQYGMLKTTDVEND